MQPVRTKKKLSRADRKQIEAAIARANRTDKKEKSAQDSIPYERMWPDGICRVADGHYTKTIQFQDINYQLSQNEDKTAIFEGWCDFLNYFDSSIKFELSFLNLAASKETFARAISIPLQGDDFDSIRVEYMTMLQNQLAKGNNGLIKTKYLTFGIDADSIKSAKPRLERIETDILNNFKRLGVAAETLDGKARLAQLHGIFHMDEQLPFRFEWDWLPSSGLSTKDFIAPSGFEFRTGKQFRILNVKLTSKPISSVALELLTPEQLEMYQVYRQTLGNKPLIFGGGSTNTSDSESLTGVQFVNGTRPGNQAVVDIAKSQVGNVGGQPFWSWYGFNSRVEWCACFVSWCYGQMGLSEPRFAGCQSQGVPWFQSHGQWGGRDYANIAPGDAIFFDWDLDGSADHVGLVVGTDGSRVYTVEGNSGDACKIRSYDLNYECIKGYGLMNW